MKTETQCPSPSPLPIGERDKGRGAFQPRLLGKSGVTVFPVGVGGGYAAPAEVFDMAADRGVNFFFYGPIFPTYIPMSRWLSSRTSSQRGKILIATVSYFWKFPGSLERSIARHLRWIKTDYLDFFFLGWIRDKDEASMEALLKMKDKGMVRHLAISAHNRKLAARLAKEWPLDAIMIRYNIAHRGADKEVFPFIPQGDRPGVIGFKTLKNGGLMRQAARMKNAPALTSTDLYRFVLSNPGFDMCLAGPKTIAHLEGVLKAVELGPLDGERYRQLEDLGDAIRNQ